MIKIYPLLNRLEALVWIVMLLMVSEASTAQTLFGLFFEDINYSADGGLYAELVQNRSFEYDPTDSKSGDIILKMVNYETISKPVKVNLNRFGKIAADAEITVLTVSKTFDSPVPAMSLVVIRIKTMKG